MDLLTYLRLYEPHELIHDGGDSYRTRTHGSLKLSNGLWQWWSQGVGGRSALDYLTKVRGVDFTEAVGIILQDLPFSPPAQSRSPSAEKRAETVCTAGAIPQSQARIRLSVLPWY